MDKITSPKKFYYDLQGSRVRQDAFAQWNEYRRQVTDRIIKSCNRGKTLAIFGAGRCNDIDLGRLAEHFGEVTLIDINESAMSAAVEQYQLREHPRVKIQVKDFVGISDEDYIEYVSIMEKKFQQVGYVLDKKTSPVLSQLDRMYQKAQIHDLDFGSNKYDYALVLNVHSQLNDTADWIRTRMLSLLRQPIDYNDPVSARILSETAGIVKKFNDSLFQATKEKAFVGYEIGMEGRSTGGIQGALQTHQDLRRREHLGQLQLRQQNFLVWPYDKEQQIVFSVLLETLSVLL